MPTPRPQPHGRDQGHTLHPPGPRPDVRDTGRQRCRRSRMLGPPLWGALGACRPLLSFQGKLPTWAVRGKPSALTSAGSQFKCLTMMVQMESNTFTGHPEAKGKKSLGHQTQISAKLVPPSYVTCGGWGMDPRFWGPSAFPEKQPRHPGKG